MTVNSRLLPMALLAVVLMVPVGAVIYSVVAAGEVPDGPVDVVWDKAPCAACGMHVGEPSFAAQLTTADGKTVAFDDPGCLFLYVAERHPAIHQMWFHHWREPRWIAGDAVAFAAAERTPMGFGLGAVDAGTANARSIDEARQLCLERAQGGR